jgi:RNA-dependent RNA polymerase
VIFKFGNFKDKNVAKNAARRGQLLTKTISGCQPKRNELIEDITVINNKGRLLVFTDGIGNISYDLMKQCCEKLKIDYTSALQVRFGGCKGILAVSPSLPNETIQYRPSMEKFKAQIEDVEVVKGANFTKGFLNRQFILLLITLKVPDEPFLHLQREMFNSHKKLMEGDDDISKLPFPFHSSFEPINCLITELDKIRFPLKQDIFIERLLAANYIQILFLLKTKARILDPKSAVLIGVIDEKKFLKENQVFLQIMPHSNTKNKYFFPIDPVKYQKEIMENKVTTIITGTVFITKNPCLHPGDIRIMEAVDIPELRHFLNVLVFPSVGSRPVTTMISVCFICIVT